MTFTIKTGESEITFHDYWFIHDSKNKPNITINAIVDVPSCCGALFIHYDYKGVLRKMVQDEKDYVNLTINYFLKLDEDAGEHTYDHDDSYNCKLWMVRFNPNIVNDEMLNEILAGLNTMFVGKTNDGLILLERQHCMPYNDEEYEDDENW